MHVWALCANVRSAFLSLEGECVHAHLFHHGQQAVATGGREVLLQADAGDEVEVGGKNFVRRVPGEHLDEQGDDTLYNESVALGLEDDFAVLFVGLQPYAALAAFYQVLVGFVAFIESWLFVAQVDEQLVAVHPVVEVTEFGDDFVLHFVDCHIYCLF